MDYDTYLDRISARATGRYDDSALFGDYRSLEAVIGDYVAPFHDSDVDTVAGIDVLLYAAGQ